MKMEEKFQLSPHIRRRLNTEELEYYLNYLLEDAEPCEYNGVGNFVSEMCDILKDGFLEDHNINASPKTKDELYHYLVDLFYKSLYEFYMDECRDN